MRRLLAGLSRRLSTHIINRDLSMHPRRFSDVLTPKGDDLQVILSCRGETQAAIYVNDGQEFRSPALQEGLDAPTSTDP